MFGRSFRVATVAGIPVNVDSSWIWIAVLAVYTLYGWFADAGLGTQGALAYAVLGAALFFFSVFLHELAHAVTARISGIAVEGITLVFFGGFTAARSEQKGAGPAFAISALGPVTSLVIGAVLWVVAGIVDPAADVGGAAPAEPVAEIMLVVARINVAMAIFNVLPGLPLDGGRMLQAAVWGITRDRDKGTRVASYGGMAVGVALFGLAILRVTRNDLFGAVWLGLIGSFIFQGARAAQQRIVLDRRLVDATVADAMDPPPTAVPADLTLSDALDRFLRGREDEAFPVVHDGVVIGMVSFASARELGSRDPLRPVREATIPLDQVVTAAPDEPLEHVLERLGTQRAAIVVDHGRLVGAVDAGAIVRYATRRA
ncbi:MAG TPA: site-2 protease family protein [Actinomycetota bacterium]|nr:site-2 protease family protein [Actinomycetota bacterium]